jgi:RimJ/RimL family protein N-acetyltransferase
VFGHREIVSDSLVIALCDPGPRLTESPPMTDFSIKPTLRGELVVLRPFRDRDADAMLASFGDAESNRLTGTHETFPDDQIRQWYATRNDQTERLDLAVEDVATGECVGEAVLNDWNADNRSCGFRILLTAAGRGRGLGTEATRLITYYGLDELGLHRIELEVYAFNPRARRAYEKAGFVAEGVRRDALLWDGEWVDAVVMSMLETDPRPRAT